MTAWSYAILRRGIIAHKMNQNPVHKCKDISAAQKDTYINKYSRKASEFIVYC